MSQVERNPKPTLNDGLGQVLKFINPQHHSYTDLVGLMHKKPDAFLDRVIVFGGELLLNINRVQLEELLKELQGNAEFVGNAHGMNFLSYLEGRSQQLKIVKEKLGL